MCYFRGHSADNNAQRHRIEKGYIKAGGGGGGGQKAKKRSLMRKKEKKNKEKKSFKVNENYSHMSEILRKTGFGNSHWFLATSLEECAQHVNLFIQFHKLLSLDSEWKLEN